MRVFKVLLCLILVLVLAGLAVFFFCDELASEAYIYIGDKALERDDRESYLTWYGRAFDRDNSKYDVCQVVALGHAQEGNFTKAEQVLYYGINASPDHTNLYLTLSSVYTMQDKLLDASVLLDSITDPTAKAGVEAVRPSAPVFSHESGSYNEYIPLTIECDDTAACFLDLTGDYPSLNGETYTGTFTLQQGETMVTAVAVNENGIVSSVVREEYFIDNVIEPVTFSDPLIESMVRKALGKDESLAIISSELWELESLKITHWDGQITDYSDLRWFRKIPSLILEGQENIDYDALLDFENLTYLMLKNCSVTTAELELISRITTLETLDLTDNSIASLSYIADMPNLKNLIVAENSLSDLGTISNMYSLEKLDLRENAVTDLSSISELKGLRYLDLEDNLVSDLSPINGMALTYLSIIRCPVGDILPVGSLLSLETFKADYCEIHDLSPLKTCSSLKTLSVSNNQLWDMNALGALSALEYADLSVNMISSAEDFSGMTALKELYLSYNSFSTVTPFVGMPSLETLDLDHNLITSVADLAGCPSLKNLYCFGSEVEDMEELSGVTVYGG